MQQIEVNEINDLAQKKENSRRPASAHPSGALKHAEWG
jgi:hypothetical protein